MPMGCPRVAYGLSTGYQRYARGMPVGCRCNEQKMNPIFTSNNVDLRNVLDDKLTP